MGLISETIIQAVAYGIDNTIACSNGGNEIILYLFALIGFVNISSSIFSGLLTGFGLGIAKIIGVIKWVIDRIRRKPS